MRIRGPELLATSLSVNFGVIPVSETKALEKTRLKGVTSSLGFVVSQGVSALNPSWQPLRITMPKGNRLVERLEAKFFRTRICPEDKFCLSSIALKVKSET